MHRRRICLSESSYILDNNGVVEEHMAVDSPDSAFSTAMQKMQDFVLGTIPKV